MKIGACVSNFGYGGVEKWLYDIIRGTDFEWKYILVERKAEPIVVKKFSELEVTVLCGENNYDLFQSELDIILMINTPTNPNHLKSSKAKLVSVCHGTGTWQKSIQLKHKDLAHYFIAVSKAASEANATETKVILNGADLNHCIPTKSREIVRKEWGITNNHKAIGFIGRITPLKNPLAVARMVGKLGVDYRAIYYGEVSHWLPEKDKKELMTQVPILSKGLCKIYPPTESIGNVLNALDLLVLPSHDAEGNALILLEAWACGLPTIATPVGAVPELEEQFGQLTTRMPIRASDTELVEAVNKALVDGKEIAERAKSVVLSNLNMERMVVEWKEFLLEITNNQ